MPDKSTALRAGLGYTIGNIFIKGINFLTLPLFSRLMTTAEFGTYNVFLSYDAVLSIVIGLAMYTSVRSAHYEFKDTDRYVSSISFFYILNTLLFLAIVLLWGNGLSSFLGIDENLLLLLIPFSFGGGIIQLYNQRISLNYDYKKYLLIALANSLGNVILSIVLMFTVFQYDRDIGRIVGTVATIFFIAIVILWNISKKEPIFQYNYKFLKFGVLYSLPIVPHGLSQVLLGQCDRIMIANMVSISAAGIYSLAGNLQLVLAVVTNSIGTSWSTWFYTQMEKNNYEAIQNNAKLLTRMFLIGTLFFLAISPEVVYLLGGINYEQGKFVAIPMIVSGFMIFLYSIIIPSEYYTKNTIYIMFGTVMAATINVVTNYIFIKIFGYIAAGYTTLFSYACYFFLHFFISRKLVKFDVIPVKTAIMVIILTLLFSCENLYFINHIIVRYSTSIIAIIILSPPLLRRGLYIITKKSGGYNNE